MLSDQLRTYLFLIKFELVLGGLNRAFALWLDPRQNLGQIFELNLILLAQINLLLVTICQLQFFIKFALSFVVGLIHDKSSFAQECLALQSLPHGRFHVHDEAHLFEVLGDWLGRVPTLLH